MYGGVTGGAIRVARTYARSPALTLAAVVAVALGVGANTAIVSVVDAAWRPLPFDDPSTLVSVWLERPGGTAGERIPLTGADLADFRAEPGLFGALSGWTPTLPTLTGPGSAEVVPGAAVTEGMFTRVLRARPLLGRSFLPEEDGPGAAPTVVLSHAFWSDHFGADPGAIGRSVVLDREPHVVVGIMPPGFRPPFRPDAALWTPARLSAERCRARCPAVPAIARLTPGTTAPAASEHARALAQRLAESYPDTNAGITARVVQLGSDGSRLSAGTVRLLFAAGGLVLLIACVNVGLLLVARGLERSHEMSVRRSLGADAWSIARQLVIESLALAALGGLLGLGLASWGIEALIRLAPPELAGLEDVGVNVRILGFTALLTAATGVLFGLAPAVALIRGGRPGAGHPGTPARWGLRAAALGRRSLVVAQITVATMLAVGAGTLLHGLYRATTAELGFEPEPLLAMSVTLPGDRFDDPVRKRLLVAALEERFGEMPGAFSVGATSALPLEEADAPVAVRIEDDPPPAGGQEPTVRVLQVSAGYFYTLGQRLAEGRWFRARDDQASAPVAIVNVSAARQLFRDPPRSPLGARIALGTSEPATWRTVVGVVRDAGDAGEGRSREGAGVPEAVVYVPIAQSAPEAVTMIVRVDGDPGGLAAAARGVLAEVDPTVAAVRIAPMREIVAERFAAERFGTVLATALAVVALLLSSVGLYGIVLHAVSSRIRELGLRKAVGATDEDLRRTVLGRALLFTVAGVLLGTVGAGFVARGLAAALAGVGVGTPLVYAIAVTAMGFVALAASGPPARRSAAIDPVTALRME